MNRNGATLGRFLGAALAALVSGFLAGAPLGGALGAERPAGGGETALLAAVNAHRSAAGAPELVADARLACAARAHASDLAVRGVLDHTGADGADLGTRLARFGYRFARAAENLALAADDVGRVALLWRASPGHARNMLDPRLTRAGIGRINGGGEGRVYWVLDLASPWPAKTVKNFTKSEHFPPCE